MYDSKGSDEKCYYGDCGRMYKKMDWVQQSLCGMVYTTLSELR